MSDVSLDQWLLADDEIIAELREVMEEEFTDLKNALDGTAELLTETRRVAQQTVTPLAAML